MRFIRWLWGKRALTVYARAALFIYGTAGLAAAVYGIYQFSPPLAWIAGGVYVVLDALLSRRAASRTDKDA